MSPLSLTGTSTQTSINLTWNIVSGNSQTGFSSLTGYSIEWDSGLGNNNFVVLNTSASNTLNITSGILTGSTYAFKVAANNVHGTGPFSTSFSIIAADIPSSIPSVVVS